MVLKGIHSPEALKRWVGLSFYPWCGKEGQNEGMVVNHLRTSHYYLGLICGWCLEYFTTGSDTMCCHAQRCLSSCACGDDDNDDDHEEESDAGNGKDNNDFTFT